MLHKKEAARWGALAQNPFRVGMTMSRRDPCIVGTLGTVFGGLGLMFVPTFLTRCIAP
jgi:hypothetical protein